MAHLPEIDTEVVRSITGPEGSWAKACGSRVRARRTSLGFTRSAVCRALSISAQSLIRIEQGQQVPRDYLRLGLAMTLFCEVDDLYPPMTRGELDQELAS